MPDRFAAVHSSAAAPTDGQTSARTLRTLHFSYMIGEKDTAYGRRERCEAFDDQIKALRGERHDIYRAKMLFQAGHGHGGLPDRDLMKDLVPIVREAAPREISWEMTDGVIRDFYWISTDAPTRGRIIEGRVTERGIEIEMPSGSTIEIFADERLVDPRSTAAIHLNGQRVASLGAPSVETLLRSLWRRGDLRRTGTMSASVTAP